MLLPEETHSSGDWDRHWAGAAMNFEDLDCRQRQVVDAVVHSDDSMLVLGGPGTGKTTTALWSARAYLENSEESPSPRALFLTFSRSAVGQIMARSPGVMSGYEDRVEVTTFHALAYRLIGSFGRYAGYGTTLPSVQTEARGKLLGYDNSKLRYNDLIPGALAILERSPHVRQILGNRWGLVICDEAQHQRNTVGLSPAPCFEKATPAGRPKSDDLYVYSWSLAREIS